MGRPLKLPTWERPEHDDVEINRHALRGELPVLLTRAAVPSGQFNEEAMTITAVISTATPVARRDAKGVYGEILDPNGIRSETEVPLLDGHAQGSIRNVIGIAKNIRVENGEVLADLRFSLADDVLPIVQRVKDGTASRFSVGYRILSAQDSKSGANRTRTATEWQLTEVSIVALGADPNARRRAANMEDEITIAPEAEQQQIRSLAELAGLTRGWAEDQIDSGATLESARSAALAQMQGRSQQTRIRTVASHDDPHQVRQRQEDAILFRAAGGELPEASRQYAEIGFRQLAVDSLNRAGVSVRGLSTDEIFQRAAEHTTSDFSLTVSNVAGKIAQQRYTAAASALMPLVRTRNLPNFKPAQTVRLGEISSLNPISESGEIKHVSHAETGETYQLATYAGALNLSRKLLIDDDLNLFGDTTAALADAAAATVSDKLAATLVGGVTLKLSDNKAVFHASRGNLGTADAAVLFNALDNARKALRTIKGVDGKTIVGAAPKYWVVSPELETSAEQLLSQVYAGNFGEVNPFVGKFELLVEPRLNGTNSYIFADPARLPTLGLAYLSSAPGPQIQRAEGWDVLGMKFRVVLDVAAFWENWRGAYLAQTAA